jgi:hypothetical protein
VIVEYTHYIYCDMLLSVTTCNFRGGAPTREHASRYPGRLHPRLMRSDECSRVSVRQEMQHPQDTWMQVATPADANAITIAAVRQEPRATPTVSRRSSSTDAALLMATSAYSRTSSPSRRSMFCVQLLSQERDYQVRFNVSTRDCYVTGWMFSYIRIICRGCFKMLL